MASDRRWLQPHRAIMLAIAIAIIAWAAVAMRWDWLPKYGPRLLDGVVTTLWLLVVTGVLGFLLALPIGLAQAAGPWWLSKPARAFCTVIRARRFCSSSGFFIMVSARSSCFGPR